MTTREEKKWERMRQMLAAGAVGADVKPVASQRTLFGIKSSVEEQIERIVAEDEARRRFAAREPQAFAFDLDGTLLDTLPDLVRVTNRALSESGFPERSTEEIKSFVGNGLKILLRRATGPAADERSIDALFSRWQEISSECGFGLTQPYEGIGELLDALKARGCRLAVVSNKVDSATQQVIGHFFPGVFDAVHGECPDYPRKPDPTGLLKTLGEMGVEPARTVYVGDSPGDVRVALDAGCFAAAALWGYRPAEELREVGAHAYFAAPLDLLTLVP